MPGLAGPGAMRDIVCAGAIELCTVWIRARESRISLWRWRRPYHSGPPVAGNGPKDTEPTPVVPRYYSPGLPNFDALIKGLAEGNTVECRAARHLLDEAARFAHPSVSGLKKFKYSGLEKAPIR